MILTHGERGYALFPLTVFFDFYRVVFITENSNNSFEKSDSFSETESVIYQDENNTIASKYIFEWLDVLVTALITVILIFSFIFRIATIDGDSMEKTLSQGEKVIITNFFYTPKVGDIVVISRNEGNSMLDISNYDLPIIKRIIATEGQTVDIDFKNGVVYVDGVMLDEPYVNTPTNEKHDIEFPITVDEGCVFVLGDNRNESLDSRSSLIGNYGMIDTRYILGHAIFRIYPFDKVGDFNI